MKSVTRALLAAAALLLSFASLNASAQPKTAKVPTRTSALRTELFFAANLNAKVLQYAESRLGQLVGRGECWDLANEALAAAGAKQPGRDGFAAYTFGAEIPLSSIRPGDILQFENVSFKHTDPSGSW
ncbi:MAG: hypothetical protein U0793_05335 [Gemmataceae bacterium]